MVNTHRSFLGSALKGFALTAVSGGIMAATFVGTNVMLGGAINSWAAATLGTGALAAGAGMVAIVAISCGIFGAILQGYSALRQNRNSHEVAYSPSNGRDIAITAASHNLFSPKLQAALDRAQSMPAASTTLPDVNPAAAQTENHFTSRLGERSSINEIVNRKLSGAPAPSFSERIEQERLAQATAPTRTLQ